MQFVINLNEEQINKLIECSGYYFEDIENISDDDVENMIYDILDNI